MSQASQKSILVNRGGAFGDLIIATAILKPLKEQGYQTLFTCHAYYASVLNHNPYIDHLIPLQEFTGENVYKALEDYPQNERVVLLDYPAPYPPADPNAYLTTPRGKLNQHIADHFCSLAGVPLNQDYYLYIDDVLKASYSNLANTVLIQTRTSFSAYKNWPDDYWRLLVARIETDLKLTVLQLATPDNYVEGIPLLDTPTLHHAFAALTQCKLFIGLDSVFNHASQALQKPSIILWGSTNPQAFGYAQNINIVNGVVWHPKTEENTLLLNCQPCYLEYKHAGVGITCPNIVKDIPICMQANTVDVVFEWAQYAVKNSLLNGYPI